MKHTLRPMRILAIITLTLLAGCQAAGRGVYQTPPESARDSIKAQKLTQDAAKAMSKDQATAEKLLREALTADLFHGPAHNNLGVIYLNQGKLYEASGEFEWARKLMPGHPDPRVNLAATLERAGRTDEALVNYESALDVAPESIAAMQGMARLQLKTGRADARTRSMLQEIALRGESAQWREWAKARLAHTP